MTESSPGYDVAGTSRSCTDASGNYLGEEPDTVVDAYVGVESTAGRLLCPGCRRAVPRPLVADPARLGGLIYFGTSDENLYLACESELDATAAVVDHSAVEAIEARRAGLAMIKPFAQTQNSR